MDRRTRDLMCSRKSDDWSTPKDFYDKLDQEFHFDYDPCPLRSNDCDALFKDWNGNIFVNPPYSNISNFLEKGLLELYKGNAKVVVFLVPARTDTKWFHGFVLDKAEIRFIKGRLKFGDSINNAPFPSLVLVYRTNKLD